MISLFDKIQESKTYIERILIPEAKIAVVLGTGLGDFAQSLTDIIEITGRRKNDIDQCCRWD